MIFEILGWITASLTIVMYLPQSFRVLKFKNALNVSKITYTSLYFVEILFVIWAPMVASLQVYVSNGLIIFLILPIIYYLFIKHKWIFFTIFTCGTIALIIGLLEWIFKWKTIALVSLILSLLLSITLGLLFFPQSFIVLKRKALEKVSGESALLICLANILWAVYWLNKIIENNLNSAVLVQLIFVFMAACAQLPIIYYFFKEKFQKKRIIKT